VASHRKQPIANTPEIRKLVAAMTNDKGIGMTEGEWNDIAIKNAEGFKLEAQQKKKK
jgi:hypothetical protein